MTSKQMKEQDETRKKLQAMNESGATVEEMSEELKISAWLNPNSGYSIVWAAYFSAHNQDEWLEKFLNYEIV